MKTLNKIFLSLGVAAAMLGFSSCVNDLDLTPTDPSQKTDVSQDIDAVFANLYLNFATYGANGNSPVHDFDGGMASFQRAMFIAECMPTDEACWLWDPATYGTLNYGLTTPSLDAVFGFYSRLMVNITCCNDFIQGVQGGRFQGVSQEKADEYVRQARILRGLCYYYMLSFYNNPPYADETTTIGAEPSQPGRAAVYEAVTADLEQVVAAYKAKDANQKAYYGFVGLDAAQSVLAKIYLNGEVFANRADYDKCYAHSKDVINRLGHSGYYGTGLAKSYQSLFGYNNDMFAIGNGKSQVNEIIWTIPQSKTADSEDLTSWSGATFMICGWIGTNGVSSTVPYPTTDAQYKDAKGEDLCFMDGDVKRVYVYCDSQEAYDKALATYNDGGLKDWQKAVNDVRNNVAYSFDPKATGYISSYWYNVNDGWKCMVTRKSFVRKFDWNNVEMSESNDTRVALWQTSSHGFTVENPSLVGDDWGKNGYISAKYSNWAYNEDGTIDYLSNHQQSTPVGGDYACIRLAEIYLTAAEAILNGGGGSEAEAVEYVNAVRQRAYGDDIATTEDDANWKWSSVSMSELRDERARELYSENVRRTDLIRWNQWCTGYTWEWKGGVENGTNLPEYTKCYPLPTRVMTSSSLQQTTGY